MAVTFGAFWAFSLGTTTVQAQTPDASQPAEAAGKLQLLKGDAARVWNWILSTSDNAGLPFVIIDKVAAVAFVFDAGGSLQGSARVLVGLARGDESVAGIGDRDISAIRPEERTTPAGRFMARFGETFGDQNVLWVDYATSISLHPVVTTNPKEHRLARIRSQAPADHRITFGCINVPAAFYKDVVLAAFSGGKGVVYVLPDTRPLEEVFPGLAVPAPVAAGAPSEAATSTAAQPTPTLPPAAASVPPAGGGAEARLK